METIKALQGKLSKARRTNEYKDNCRANFLNKVAFIKKDYSNAVEREVDYEGTIARNYLEMLIETISEFEKK